MIAINSEL